METISYREKIDYYLEKNRIEGYAANDKERIKKLKAVIFNEKINLDFNELRRSHNDLTKDEYLELLEKSRSNICQSIGYIAIVEEMVKQERKDKRKANMQKIKSIFRKK